jgi:cytochrome c oxidase subunit 3
VASYSHAEHIEHAHEEHPPEPHYSSRVSPSVLGMFMCIGTEVMLFGAFFTAYFFVRVVAGTAWPTPPFHLPVYVAFLNTLILVTSSFNHHTTPATARIAAATPSHVLR